MIALIQRVRSASVDVASQRIAEIDQGLLVLAGIERGDTETQAERLAERVLNYRVFADEAGKMNLSVSAIGGEILLVPQFTLAADTRSGNRPGFSTAATPETGVALFEHLLQTMQQSGQVVHSGRFGADMQVSLCNDGPVTFSLQVKP
ncbi:MAG: D-aminoacyl-tRNA deacylase [Gammaproteobacteria bacterium]